MAFMPRKALDGSLDVVGSCQGKQKPPIGLQRILSAAVFAVICLITRPKRGSSQEHRGINSRFHMASSICISSILGVRLQV